MSRLYRCALVSIWLAILGAKSVAADSAGNWNISHFTADGATLNRAASAVNSKSGTDVIVLDEEDTYVFDAEGKALHTHYLAYKVLTQKGAEG